MVINLGSYLHHSRLLLCTVRLRLMLLLLGDNWLLRWPIFRCRSNNNNYLLKPNNNNYSISSIAEFLQFIVWFVSIVKSLSVCLSHSIDTAIQNIFKEVNLRGYV